MWQLQHRLRLVVSRRGTRSLLVCLAEIIRSMGLIHLSASGTGLAPAGPQDMGWCKLSVSFAWALPVCKCKDTRCMGAGLLVHDGCSLVGHEQVAAARIVSSQDRLPCSRSIIRHEGQLASSRALARVHRAWPSTGCMLAVQMPAAAIMSLPARADLQLTFNSRPPGHHTQVLRAQLLQMRLAYELFTESGVMEEFGLDERVLAHFIANVASNYHGNPYHNFTHAIYVLQATFLILKVVPVMLGAP